MSKTALLMTTAVLGLAVFILVLTSISLSKPYRPEAGGSIFRVQKGESFMQISGNLERGGFISEKWLFTFYVLAKLEHDNLRAGSYFLSPSMNVKEIANIITEGKTADFSLVVPEGFNLKQITERLNNINPSLGVFVGDQKIGQYKDIYDFFKDSPDSSSLEGFLFPDTYRFSIEAEGEEIVLAMLSNFDSKFTADLREDLKNQKRTLWHLVIMASLLEKEVQSSEDRKLVSGILWKRLEAGMPLQVDATIIYITGGGTTKVSKEDTRIDSPYNTYKYAGLPAGPISNPGLDSILAAIYPEKSSYWFYLSTQEGETIFSKTLEEHNRAKAKYLK